MCSRYTKHSRALLLVYGLPYSTENPVQVVKTLMWQPPASNASNQFSRSHCEAHQDTSCWLVRW